MLHLNILKLSTALHGTLRRHGIFAVNKKLLDNIMQNHLPAYYSLCQCHRHPLAWLTQPVTARKWVGVRIAYAIYPYKVIRENLCIVQNVNMDGH